MQTDKLVSYRSGGYPQIAGGDKKYLTDELRKVQNSIASTQSILKGLETAGTVASKAGAVTAADLDAGTWRVIYDSANDTLGLYANVSGVLFSVMLA